MSECEQQQQQYVRALQVMNAFCLFLRQRFLSRPPLGGAGGHSSLDQCRCSPPPQDARAAAGRPARGDRHLASAAVSGEQLALFAFDGNSAAILATHPPLHSAERHLFPSPLIVPSLRHYLYLIGLERRDGGDGPRVPRFVATGTAQRMRQEPRI